MTKIKLAGSLLFVVGALAALTIEFGGKRLFLDFARAVRREE